MFMTDKMRCFLILFLVFLTALNSVECGDSGCRAIPPQDANDPTTAVGLFALSDDGFKNPVNQIHIVPNTTETSILIKDTHSFTLDHIPAGLTWAYVIDFGQRDVPTNIERTLGDLQEDDSRFDIYVFYTGNQDDIGVAAVFDSVQKEDGFYRTFFGNETQLFRVLKFNSIEQVTNVDRTHGPLVMLAPKATMVYVNCDSVPATPPPPSSLATAIQIHELKDQVELLTEKVDQQKAELTSLMTKIDKKNAPMVAFSAYRGGNVVGDRTIIISKDGTMKFPEVLTNVGGAYNPDSGAFTAPAHGVYQLAVGVQCSKRGTPLRLVCGARHVMSLYTNCRSNSLESNSVLVELDGGAKCRVKPLAGHGSTFYDILWTHFGRVGTSTFSGHLITLK